MGKEKINKSYEKQDNLPLRYGLDLGNGKDDDIIVKWQGRRLISIVRRPRKNLN